MRGTLKSWTKLWCILKPGLILLYKSDKTKVLNLIYANGLLLLMMDELFITMADVLVVIVFHQQRCVRACVRETSKCRQAARTRLKQF